MKLLSKSYDERVESTNVLVDQIEILYSNYLKIPTDEGIKLINYRS